MGPVRVSFLQDSNALKETVGFLKLRGCAAENCNVLTTAVKEYGPFDYDLTGFPPSTNGTYTFASMSNFVSALPRPFDYSRHAWGLTCYDTVVLLANQELRMAQGPDQRLGTFFAPARTTNDSYSISPVSTPREAFLLSCPIWDRQLIDPVLPEAVREARVCLMAAFYRFYRLPNTATLKTIPRDVLGGLRAAWKEEGLAFPKTFKIVLCHAADPPQGWFFTYHAGLLFNRKDTGYTYLEKSGGAGPFVRIDFESERDLMIYLRSAARGTGGRHFVSLNDEEFQELDSVEAIDLTKQ
jgi:hypothetical protein